jgi:hypothetical protein
LSLRVNQTFSLIVARTAPGRAALAFDGGATPVALDIHLQDGGVTHEPSMAASVMALSGNTLPHSPGGCSRYRTTRSARGGNNEKLARADERLGGFCQV